MFFVMKAEHLAKIPKPLVLKRWRLDAKSPNKYVEIGRSQARGVTYYAMGVVKDPEVAKSKGATQIAKTVHKKGRRCTCCKRTGYTKRKCPERRTRKSPRAENNYVDPSQTEVMELFHQVQAGSNVDIINKGVANGSKPTGPARVTRQKRRVGLKN
ncbi:hypothetical protein Ahy_A10g049746 [Arachis hypogaea]|uniref:CCHC-type domain-containing protein n=1 Tax=Arachis hypogaea TaxID=3818 RepID=A0A445B7U9_ARAHY|nr:hypothetical protein Ahy_A10g049746 [Arachis hypogaea]